MEIARKPFQGVLNIIWFNWHFYLIAGFLLLVLFFIHDLLPQTIQCLIFIFSIATSYTIIISLLISCYVYDFSGLYHLGWLENHDNKKILNINAGFDETSTIIRCKYKNSSLSICDFYDPQKHTEVSIKRARKAYPPQPDTISVETKLLPFNDHTFDTTLAILSAHEIREEEERIQFFKELNRITTKNGQIIVTEHLRDWKNFLAYNIGFLHFYSKATWMKTFEKANLTIKKELGVTPFIRTFILEKNGNTN